MSTQQIEVIRASEVKEKVIDQIARLRFPERLEEYEDLMRRYQKRRGQREEVKRDKSNGWYSVTETGFYLHDGQVFVPRPERPRWHAYSYSGYSRDGYRKAGFAGLLADSRYNRDLRLQRVQEYVTEMRGGRWRDLMSDPITITADGHVLNGQHRICAVEDVDQEPGWAQVGNDPAFLVIWNADSGEAQYADGSSRTARDQKVIADKLIAGLRLIDATS